jgi:RHS repeat-associated protein
MYTAWGEAMYEYTAQSTTGSFDSPYRFNGKELDKETGYGYYGARYYKSKLSMWLSVDRLSAKYPDTSPYVFSGNNPMYFIDPNGDSILTTTEGYRIIQEGLTATLGKDNPFSYDSEKGAVIFNSEADLSNYDPEQLEVIERIGSLAVSPDNNVNVMVAKRSESVTFAGETGLQLKNWNHGEGGGANGLTSSTRVGPNQGTTVTDVLLASDAVNRIGSVFIPNRGLAALHEIGGHASEQVNFPNSSPNTWDQNTTQFEQLCRNLINKNAGRKVFRSKALDH